MQAIVDRLAGARSGFALHERILTFGSSVTSSGEKRAAAWLRRRAIRFALIGSITVFGVCQKANATDWDLAQDGRIVIPIKGIKFVFPSGSDLDSVHFDIGRPQHATLRGVLAAPDTYREIFEKNANTTITMWVVRAGGLYLNRFNRDELNSVGFAFDVGDNQKNCTSWRKAFDRAKAEDSKGQKLEYGWRESVAAGIEKIYTREGPEEIQSLYCNERGYCGSSICLLPNVTFVFRFSTLFHPKSQWADLLKKIQDVLNYVIPERSAGKVGQQ